MTAATHRQRRQTARAKGTAAALAVIAALTLAGCGSSSDTDGAAPQSAQAQSTQEANRALVLEFYDGFFNRHDPAAASVIAENYKQHNPQVPDGKAAFVDLLTANFAKNPNSNATVVRSAVDGDLVYLHVHSTNGPDDSGQAIVDIFRVDNGAIVEHWDVIQPVPQTAANSNTMF
ncbi:MAG: hypothetical protein EOO27_03430 [Comamonadaceae bacterium]|jgi:predicted SnoaL-like aldol condensation-catalyzing enzyme|nr:MAG: hypothetical protein EOO27_03430 [Comamonadaceae bacterium]